MTSVLGWANRKTNAPETTTHAQAGILLLIRLSETIAQTTRPKEIIRP
ncbi:hypothetical protein [Aquiluna sp. KACHI24]|nr:hypothetical protein [Aquiluna sp. KACHI24]